MPRYKVVGFDRETGYETDLVVEAADRWEARRMGNERGIEVYGAEAVSVSQPPGPRRPPMTPRGKVRLLLGIVGVSFIVFVFAAFASAAAEPDEIGAVSLFVCAASGIVLFAGLPGWVAEHRGHHNTDAIRLCGVIGLLIWPCWLVALIWAHTRPTGK